MKLRALMYQIQKKLDAVDWTKIKTHKAFHEIVAAIVQEIGQGFNAVNWEICFGHDKDIVFKYDRDFVKDARCTFNDRGKFSNVKVHLANGMGGLMEVSELDTIFKLKKINSAIAYHKKSIDDCLVAITKSTEHIKKLTAERNELMG